MAGVIYHVEERKRPQDIMKNKTNFDFKLKTRHFCIDTHHTLLTQQTHTSTFAFYTFPKLNSYNAHAKSLALALHNEHMQFTLPHPLL